MPRFLRFDNLEPALERDSNSSETTSEDDPSPEEEVDWAYNPDGQQDSHISPEAPDPAIPPTQPPLPNPTIPPSLGAFLEKHHLLGPKYGDIRTVHLLTDLHAPEVQHYLNPPALSEKAPRPSLSSFQNLTTLRIPATAMQSCATIELLGFDPITAFAIWTKHCMLQQDRFGPVRAAMKGCGFPPGILGAVLAWVDGQRSDQVDGWDWTRFLSCSGLLAASRAQIRRVVERLVPRPGDREARYDCAVRGAFGFLERSWADVVQRLVLLQGWHWAAACVWGLDVRFEGRLWVHLYPRRGAGSLLYWQGGLGPARVRARRSRVCRRFWGAQVRDMSRHSMAPFDGEAGDEEA